MKEREIKILVDEIRLSFGAFKSWYNRRYNVGITLIKNEKELYKQIDKYKKYMNGGLNLKYHKINYNSFKCWIQRYTGMKIGEIDREMQHNYIDKYKHVQFKSSTSKDNMISVIRKLIYEEAMNETEYSIYEYIKNLEVENV